MALAPLKSSVLGTSYPERPTPRRCQKFPPFSNTARTLLKASWVTCVAGEQPAALGVAAAWGCRDMPDPVKGGMAMAFKPRPVARLRAKVLVRSALV